MPKLRSGEEWAKSLRQDIKTEIGLGWNVCGHKRNDGTLSGSCKLTHRTEDGRRSSVMLPFRWEASSKRQILNRVIAICKCFSPGQLLSHSKLATKLRILGANDRTVFAPCVYVSGVNL